MRGHGAAPNAAIVGMIEIPAAIVVDKHRTINVASHVACLMNKRTQRTVAGEHIVAAASWRCAHIELAVPVDHLRRIGHSRCLVGTTNIGRRPINQIFRTPAVDVAVASADIEVVVAFILHDVWVAQTSVVKSWQYHGVDPLISLWDWVDLWCGL